VWACKLAIELGFPQLKPTDVHEDNTDCIALANNLNMHLRGRSKHAVLRVCSVIQKLKFRWTNQRQAMLFFGAKCKHTIVNKSNINQMGTKALPRVPFETLRIISSATSRLATNDSHSALSKSRVSAFKFHLVCDGRLFNLQMSLSYFASALSLCIGLGDL